MDMQGTAKEMFAGATVRYCFASLRRGAGCLDRGVSFEFLAMLGVLVRMVATTLFWVGICIHFMSQDMNSIGRAVMASFKHDTTYHGRTLV